MFKLIRRFFEWSFEKIRLDGPVEAKYVIFKFKRLFTSDTVKFIKTPKSYYILIIFDEETYRYKKIRKDQIANFQHKLRLFIDESVKPKKQTLFEDDEYKIELKKDENYSFSIISSSLNLSDLSLNKRDLINAEENVMTLLSL